MSDAKEKAPDYDVKEARISAVINIGMIVGVCVFLAFICGRIEQNRIKQTLIDTTVPTALNEHLAAEDVELTAYKAVDAANDVYQIPIEAAMAALVSNPDNIKRVPTDLVIQPPPDPTEDPAGFGKFVFMRKGSARCITCHNMGPGPKKMGPDLSGRYGQDVKLADGTTVKFDEAYILKSIKDPGADISDGFQPVMPPNIIDLNGLDETDLKSLVEYLKVN